MKTTDNRTLIGTCFLALLVFCSDPSFAKMNANNFYPLTLNNSWDYENHFYPHTEKILDTLTVDEKLYYGLSMWSSDVTDYWIRNENDIVYILNMDDSTESILFHFNADIDVAWELPAEYDCSFGRYITLESINDTITTPAGEFICIHFMHQSFCNDAGMHDSWFAEGIGKVRYISDNIAGVLDCQLTSYSVATSIPGEGQGNLAESFHLSQNYPNPFNSVTTIEYRIVKSSQVNLNIYSLVGQKIATLAAGRQSAGIHTIIWDASGCSSGVYFYRLDSDLGFTQTRKIILMK